MFGHDGRIVTKVYQWAGTYYYFDPNTYLRVDNDYRQSQWGDWYMFGPDGRIVTGLKEWYGSYYYFDPTTYLKVTNKWIDNNYFGPAGQQAISRFERLDNKYYYFDANGAVLNIHDQFKNIDNHTYYFGADGACYTSQFLNKDGKQYYFDNDGIMLTDQEKIIDGKFYHFNVNGEAIQVNDPSEIWNTVAKQVATALNNENIQNVEYDWQSKDHNYRELALHDLAQEVARGDTKANKASIADKLKKNSLLTGNVLSVFTTNFNNVDLSTLVQRFINSFNPADANNSVLGVGADASKDQLAIVLFKPGQENVSQKASSPVNVTISTVLPCCRFQCNGKRCH